MSTTLDLPEIGDEVETKTGMGVVVDNEPNLQALLAFRSALLAIEAVHKTQTADTGKYCLAPWTQVLTADLRWVDVKALEAGDEIAAFDEFPTSSNGHRHWRKATVLASKPVHLPAYRITLDDGGQLTASADHRWLSRRPKLGAQWVHTADLTIGTPLVRMAHVWHPLRNYEAGWLAGLYDGEGSLYQQTGSERGSWHLSVSQNEGIVLDTAKRYLDDLGYRYTIQPDAKKRCMTVRLRGGRAEMQQFLGTVRPLRLLDRLDYDRFGRVWPIARPKVTGIEFLGEQELIATATSTETLVAEGIASHNSYRYANLADVLEEVKRVCEMFRLAMTQTATAEDGMLMLGTTLIHESGGCYQPSPIVLPLPREAQALGSAITYLRRYALVTIFGIPVEDDDGKAATQAERAPEQYGGYRSGAEERIHAEFTKLEQDGEHEVGKQVRANFREYFHVGLSDLPVGRHGDALEWVLAAIPATRELAAENDATKLEGDANQEIGGYDG